MQAATHIPAQPVAIREVSAPEALARAPKVSVLTITYRHEAFLPACIESVMAQQTDFDFEMVIGEDCSPDRSRAICEDYQRRYPDRIRLMLPERNVGRHHNWRCALKACRGRYIALVEGDDLWTRTDKLQRQADLLDRHPEWAICCHNVALDGENRQGRTIFFDQPQKPVFTIEDLVPRNFIPTCSCLYRAGLTGALPEWYYDPAINPYTDWVLHALNALHGDIGYLDEVMAVHRRHGGGVWGGTFDGSVEGDIRRLRDRIATYRLLRRVMPSRLRGCIRRQAAEDRFHLGLALRSKGERLAACGQLLRAATGDALRAFAVTVAGSGQ